MDAHELAEKVRNSTKTRELYEEVVEWCSENKDKLDMSNKDYRFLFDIGTRYLLKIKIGNWNKEEASVAVHYLAKKAAKQIGIDENVTVKILEETEYREIHGDDSRAICINNGDDTFNISYSPKVVENLLSKDSKQFLRGLQTTFHEVVHAMQNSLIQRADIKVNSLPKSKIIYLMALETIARKQSSKFYDDNYAHLLKENNAEKLGLRMAMETIKGYCRPNIYALYDQKDIAKRLEDYDKNFYESKMTMGGKEFDPLLQIDSLSAAYIERHPDIIERFPVLQVGYNLDGTKKGIKQLLFDREERLSTGENLEQVNGIYEAIANHSNLMMGGLKGPGEEYNAIKEYIRETGTDDEFVFGLIRYKLEEAKIAPEKIERIIQRQHMIAAQIRKERAEQEQGIVHEEDESIKDEVGDEDKPKTTGEKAEEQAQETEWQNRFQAWDRDSLELPNSAKRKEEAVESIQEAKRQRDLRDKQVQEQEGQSH